MRQIYFNPLAEEEVAKNCAVKSLGQEGLGQRLSHGHGKLSPRLALFAKQLGCLGSKAGTLEDIS